MKNSKFFLAKHHHRCIHHAPVSDLRARVNALIIVPIALPVFISRGFIATAEFHVRLILIYHLCARAHARVRVCVICLFSTINSLITRHDSHRLAAPALQRGDALAIGRSKKNKRDRRTVAAIDRGKDTSPARRSSEPVVLRFRNLFLP